MLAAAAEVIAERGLAATRIADVAARAGTSPPAVLYWFDSKDELLAEALTVDEERWYTELTERMAALAHPRERLRMILEASAREYDLTLWMELWTRALRDRPTSLARKRLDGRWRAEIANVIREGQAAGEFGEADAEETALVLASLMDGLAVQVTLRDPAVGSQRMLAMIVEVAERLLDADLEAAADEKEREVTSMVRETVPHADTELRRELE